MARSKSIALVIIGIFLTALIGYSTIAATAPGTTPGQTKCESDKRCPQAQDDICDEDTGWDPNSIDLACQEAVRNAKAECEGKGGGQSSCAVQCINCNSKYKYPPDDPTGKVYTCEPKISCNTAKIVKVAVTTDGTGTIGFHCTAEACGRCCCDKPKLKKEQEGGEAAVSAIATLPAASNGVRLRDFLGRLFR